MQGAGQCSDFGLLRQSESIIDIQAKIADGILDIGMAEQDFHRPQISCNLVDEGGFSAAHGMRAVLPLVDPNRRYPFIDEPRVLPGAQMTETVDPAGEDEVTNHTATPFRP